MTDETGNPTTPFAMGSGHFYPKRASDPGLIYDASYMDYLLYLCNLNLTQHINLTYNCPNPLPQPFDLNYPSIQIHKLNYTKTVKRTVTNVGSSKSVYKFIANPPKEFTIKATPSVLKFKHVGQKRNFVITVTANRDQLPSKSDPEKYYFGWYIWTDKYHVVRSPIAVSFQWKNIIVFLYSFSYID